MKMAISLEPGLTKSNSLPMKGSGYNSFLSGSAMANGIRWKKGWLFVAVAVAVVVTIFLFLSSTGSDKYIPASRFSLGSNSNKGNDAAGTSKSNNWFWTQGYTVWPEFSPKPIVSHAHFKSSCVKNGNYSITGLKSLITELGKSQELLCQSLLVTFNALFSVEARKAYLNIPDTFKGKVSRWLNNDEKLVKEVYNQDVIHMVNKFTREHTVFNPLRDKRPVHPPDVPEQKYVDDIVHDTEETCDFCKFKENTAEHKFGRLESEYAFTASNVFKIDSLHALVALKSHHPLKWSREQFLDLMGLTVRWLRKAKQHHPSAKYPALIWDILPHCGASQVHPHIQVVFDPSRYHGIVESWREGAQDYNYHYESNYFTDLVGVYSALGLTATYGNATVFANLVPKKDHEVVVIAKEADADFFNLLFFTLRAFVDDLHAFCYSMGIGYPALGENRGKIPAFARIITRGPVTDNRADISSLELFTAGNVNIDPWKTIQAVRESISKRSNTK